MKFRTLYDGEVYRSGFKCVGASRTKQSMKDECDVNIILSRYKKTGVLPPVGGPGQFGDFSQVTDFGSAMNEICRAKELFYAQPAHIRELVDNDPGKFLAFVQDPKNADKLVELGLANPKAGGPGSPGNSINEVKVSVAEPAKEAGASKV